MSAFYSWREHLAIDLPGARALFTTRRGGFSKGAYESLNLGRLTDDRPQDVGRNQALLEEGLGVSLARVRQVHGREVICVTELPSPEKELPEADGQATTLRGVALMMLAADCLPIAVAAHGAGQGEGAVAMLHAGWRGLDEGVVPAGIRAVRELCDQGPLAAAIGPGAGGCCYEVGEEVHAAFEDYGPEARRGTNLDLKAIARTQLEQAGVEVIHDAELCTICDPSMFFSHRRDRGRTGRQAGIVWLN